MRTWILALMASLAAGCVNQPENYKPAGFHNYSHVLPYKNLASYLNTQLTKTEWERFYKHFPEYIEHKEVREHLPWLTAYNFRWTTLNHKKPTWPGEKTRRLNGKKIKPGDTPFEIFYALGPPDRMIWDNDFEILLYKSDLALIMETGILKEIKPCIDCWEFPDDVGEDSAPELIAATSGMHDWDILKILGFKRPPPIR